MAVDYRTVTGGQNRDLEAKLLDGCHHPVHDVIVLPRIAFVRLQLANGQLAQGECIFPRARRGVVICREFSLRLHVFTLCATWAKGSAGSRFRNAVTRHFVEQNTWWGAEWTNEAPHHAHLLITSVAWTSAATSSVKVFEPLCSSTVSCKIPP